jgi:uncharacterized protein (TIGR01777 family)
MSGKVLISGASGPIGAALLPLLRERGYAVTKLVRHSDGQPDQIVWDPLQSVAADSVSGFDAVIHLAGESIVGRWNPKKKAAIRNSRVLGTRHLAEALAKAKQGPRVLVSASAVGYYGDRGEEILQEDSPPGQGFLPDVCREWEAATEAASRVGIRVVHVRIAMVLSPKGGALAAMVTPFRLGVGGRIGSGQQWMGWIDVRDLAAAFVFVMENDSIAGAVNGASPNGVRNAEFTKTLASVLSRPAILPLPAFVARLVLGEMADELILASQHVTPNRLTSSGFRFQYADLAASLRANLQR